MRMLYLDMHSRKVCMAVSASHCCNDPITEINRFRVEIIREGDPKETPLLGYNMFDVRPDGHMCVLLDSEMGNLPTGRYLFKVIFDECTVIAFVKFMWADVPVVTDVSVESNPFEDCLDCGEVSPSKLPVSSIRCEEEVLEKSCADLNPKCEC